MMCVNTSAARCRPSLGVNILIAEGGIGPRPTGTYHQRLEVILAGKADRNGTVVLVVIIDLLTRHWAASDESDESLCRQRPGIPVAIIARLSLRERRCRTSGRADDRTSRYRRPTPRSHARFLCRWYLSLSGQMRARPRSKVRSAPTRLSLAAPTMLGPLRSARTPPTAAHHRPLSQRFAGVRQRPPTTRLTQRNRSKNSRYRMRGPSRARSDQCTMAASGAPRVRKLGL